MKQSKKTYTWITELLMFCNCKKSPFTVIFNSKYTSSSGMFKCKKCKTKEDKKDYFKNFNAWAGRKRHYIKLPKPMTCEQVTEWLKKNKTLLLKKEDLQALTKSKTTFTTKAQKDWEKKKKEVIKPIKRIKTKNGVKIVFFGKVPTQRQIQTPEEDMTLHLGIVGKRIVIQKYGVTVSLNFNKNLHAEEVLEEVLKLVLQQSKEPKDPYYLWKIIHIVQICVRCKKKTNNGYCEKQGSKEVICLSCYKEKKKVIKK